MTLQWKDKCQPKKDLLETNDQANLNQCKQDASRENRRWLRDETKHQKGQ
jgi:hypothetical protein